MRMMTMLIDDISVNATEGMSRIELAEYVRLMREKYPSMYLLEVEQDGDFVNLTVTTRQRPFERLRRITGYLVGTMDRWNNAKRAEEGDRVKHSLEA